jgi:hypothetical protein
MNSRLKSLADALCCAPKKFYSGLRIAGQAPGGVEPKNAGRNECAKDHQKTPSRSPPDAITFASGFAWIDIDA